jgi:hypothetical protein
MLGSCPRYAGSSESGEVTSVWTLVLRAIITVQLVYWTDESRETPSLGSSHVYSNDYLYPSRFSILDRLFMPA